MSIREYLHEREIDDAVILEPEGLDEAIIGIGQDGRLVYSYPLLIRAFMEIEEMSEDEAIEWIDYNTIRAIPYMGDKAPIIMYELEEPIEALADNGECTLYLVERDCKLPICDIHKREECSKKLFANLIGKLNDCIGKIKAK